MARKTMARKAIRRNPKGLPGERDGADLRMVLEAIREALKEAQAKDVGFPALESIEITLQTIATVSLSATVKFRIITIDAKVETENTSTLSLTMKPPPTQNTVDPSPEAIQQDLKIALAKAINLAKIGILDANQGDPKFLTNKVVIDQKFVVKIELSAGIKIELLPVGFELKAKVARNQSHQVKLTFGK